MEPYRTALPSASMGEDGREEFPPVGERKGTVRVRGRKVRVRDRMHVLFVMYTNNNQY